MSCFALHIDKFFFQLDFDSESIQNLINLSHPCKSDDRSVQLCMEMVVLFFSHNIRSTSQSQNEETHIKKKMYTF